MKQAPRPLVSRGTFSRRKWYRWLLGSPSQGRTDRWIKELGRIRVIPIAFIATEMELIETYPSIVPAKEWRLATFQTSIGLRMSPSRYTWILANPDKYTKMWTYIATLYHVTIILPEHDHIEPSTVPSVGFLEIRLFQRNETDFVQNLPQFPTFLKGHLFQFLSYESSTW